MQRSQSPAITLPAHVAEFPAEKKEEKDPREGWTSIGKPVVTLEQ